NSPHTMTNNTGVLDNMAAPPALRAKSPEMNGGEAGRSFTKARSNHDFAGAMETPNRRGLRRRGACSFPGPRVMSNEMDWSASHSLPERTHVSPIHSLRRPVAARESRARPRPGPERRGPPDRRPGLAWRAQLQAASTIPDLP